VGGHTRDGSRRVQLASAGENTLAAMHSLSGRRPASPECPRDLQNLTFGAPKADDGIPRMWCMRRLPRSEKFDAIGLLRRSGVVACGGRSAPGGGRPQPPVKFDAIGLLRRSGVVPCGGRPAPGGAGPNPR